MNWSKFSDHYLKYESINRDQVKMQVHTQQQSYNKSTSFHTVHGYDQLTSQLRCQSVHCEVFGQKTAKQKKSHHLQMELAEHKRQRLTQVIIQNLKKNPLSQQNSARNLVFKQQNGSPKNYSSFLKKVKDFKHDQPMMEKKFEIGKTEKTLSSRQPSLQVDLVQETKETINFTCSPGSSPRFQSLSRKNNQFIVKQYVHKSSTLEKLLTETKFHSKVPLSPRSIMVSEHKKVKSVGLSAYSEQNKFLRRIMFRLK